MSLSQIKTGDCSVSLPNLRLLAIGTNLLNTQEDIKSPFIELQHKKVDGDQNLCQEGK